LLLGITALLTAPGLATADDFPSRPVTMVVGSTPGSAPDTLARIIAAGMSGKLGQPVVVENRPGAAGSIAASSVARTDPDGYTMMMMTAVHTISPSLRKNIDYDTAKDFRGIGMVASVPLLLVVSNDLGVDTMDAFVAKAADGSLFYSTPGVGTLQHLATEDFSKVKGIKMTTVPYKGGGPATQAVIAGEVDLFYAGIPPALPHVKAGTLKALGISTPKRSPAAPDVPTFQELGFPDYDVDNWHSLQVPAGTPDDVVAKLNAALNETLAEESTAEQFLNVGATPAPGNPDELDALVEKETVRWKRIIDENNITLEN
jgi:tripartite-type tricarboxylate transporter receptor subunit TctC